MGMGGELERVREETAVDTDLGAERSAVDGDGWSSGY